MASCRARSAGTPNMRSMLAAVMPASPAAGRLPMAACKQMPSRGLGRPASSDSSPRRAALAANSRGVCRPDSQPSPNRTARRRAAVDWPPIHSGGTGMAGRSEISAEPGAPGIGVGLPLSRPGSSRRNSSVRRALCSRCQPAA